MTEPQRRDAMASPPQMRELLRRIEEQPDIPQAARPYAPPTRLGPPVPGNEFGRPDPGTEGRLRALAEALRSVPAPTPEVGQMASQAMAASFAEVIRQVEALAQEHVDRALALQQEIRSYGVVLKESGEVLCRRIEEEAARGLRIRELIKTARTVIGEKTEDGRSAIEIP